ncbi:metalloprotease [Coemansia thaxteri]|uniref:Metalloprotease n=1 Tax=Coemansia thaxteri TaxID=2663907 RepID=A0A9W8BB14_9FUNG|nr:metalloprotease [Coemansia thaxteri]
MDFFTNCKPADWKTGFEPRLSVESAMPHEEYAGPIEMSGNDKRQYRLIRLPNNLVALCVQDSESEEASVSLSVGVGSNANSAQLQGLAHFLEHMLFLGTEKYPKEGGYNEYISNNSGRTNASGNIQTLRDAANALGLNLRDEMIKFYEKYYSADIMRLVVVGNHSLDVLTEWTVSKFSAVKSKGNTTPNIDCRLLSSAEIGKVVRYKTVGEQYQLELQFSIPEINNGFGHFRIGVTATPKGLEEYQAIVSLIFAYVQMLKEQGPQEWYFQELALVKKAKYDYKAREDVCDYACDITSRSHNKYVPPNHILSHSELLGNYDAELISACLHFINPQNYRLFIGAQEHKSVDCHLKEKHYDILHHIADLPVCLTSDECAGSASGESIHLPARNVFLPDNFTVAKLATAADKPTSEPTLLRKNDKYEVWFKQDDQFFTPHGCISLIISSETTDNSPINQVLSQLFIHV